MPNDTPETNENQSYIIGDVLYLGTPLRYGETIIFNADDTAIVFRNDGTKETIYPKAARDE